MPATPVVDVALGQDRPIPRCSTISAVTPIATVEQTFETDALCQQPTFAPVDQC
jgi:hypothetical protein